MFAVGAIGSNVTELLVASKLVRGSDSLLQLLYIIFLSLPTLANINASHFHIITTPRNLS